MYAPLHGTAREVICNTSQSEEEGVMARMLIRQIYLEWSAVDGHILKGGRNLEIRAGGSKTQSIGNNISSVITYHRAALW